jgi:hypothetical protein
MPTINFSEINWLAVIVAAFATFMLGGVWYTAIFGRAWQRLHGYSDEQLAQMRARRPPPVFFGTMLVCYVIVALVVAMIAQLAGVSDARSGALLGLLIWVIVAAVGATGHVASHWPWSAFGIDVLYQLIYFTMIGAIVGGWR